METTEENMQKIKEWQQFFKYVKERDNKLYANN